MRIILGCGNSSAFRNARPSWRRRTRRWLVEAQNRLAYLYEAANAGDVDACVDLGRLFARQGALDKAKTYYLAAADKGDLVAQYRLGIMHRRYGDRAISFDESARWLIRPRRGDTCGPAACRRT